MRYHSNSDWPGTSTRVHNDLTTKSQISQIVIFPSLYSAGGQGLWSSPQGPRGLRDWQTWASGRSSCWSGRGRGLSTWPVLVVHDFCENIYKCHLLHQVSDCVPVLHGGGVVQVALDGEALVIENHHTDNIRRILTINRVRKTSHAYSGITVILLMMSDISSLHSTMLLLDTVVAGARDIRLLELLFLEAIPFTKIGRR